MGIVANIKNWKNGDTGNSGSGSSLASTSSAQTASGVAIPMLGHEQQEQVAVGKQDWVRQAINSVMNFCNLTTSEKPHAAFAAESALVGSSPTLATVEKITADQSCNVSVAAREQVEQMLQTGMLVYGAGMQDVNFPTHGFTPNITFGIGSQQQEQQFAFA